MQEGPTGTNIVEVFEAIVCSNGWDEVTAALQLIAHLDGEALNVALLVLEAQRILPGCLLKTLLAHCASPGRLAKYKRHVRKNDTTRRHLL